jgi:cellulose synthase/poly-beta-1,6-N-acetylglucosamine synthase-like glycosyltransferase
VNALYALLIFFSYLRVHHYRKQNNLLTSENLPGVSFIVPAYNEETLIVETIQTYLMLPNDKKEVIVIDDGSKDQTMRLLMVMFQLKKINRPKAVIYQSIIFPNLVVIQANHLGKASALNLGVQLANYDLVCTIDADTIPAARGVNACLRAFKSDPKLIACSGVMKVLSNSELKPHSPLRQRAEEWLTCFQRIEYLRAFVCERLGWSFLGSSLLISGAFCMLKRDALLKIGGFRPRSLAEDFDLIIRLKHHYPSKFHNISILPVTTCFTQVPRGLRHLSKQRMRWQMGLLQTLFQNSSLFLHPKHRFMGMIAIPYFWLVEGLSPLIAVVSLTLIPFALYDGLLELPTIMTYFSFGLIINLLITYIGISIDNNFVSESKHWSLGKSLFQSLILQLGYKQLILWWRFLASIRAFSSNATWGEHPRVEIIHQN